MNLLLDTQVFIWWRANPDRILDNVRDRIATTAVVFVSVVSVWEAAIKAALGKLRYPGSFTAAVRDSGMHRLSLGFEQAEMSAQLPFHHKDPFDRALIAQAKAEQLTIVTTDRMFEKYDVSLMLT